MAALDQAVSGYNQLLASDGPALHAAYARRDGAKIHAAALSLLLATEGFDSTLQPVANFGPARVDETTLMTTNQRVGAALESILEAANFSDVASAYAQLQVAQRAEQANLDQVARDVGAPAPLKLASITG